MKPGYIKVLVALATPACGTRDTPSPPPEAQPAKPLAVVTSSTTARPPTPTPELRQPRDEGRCGKGQVFVEKPSNGDTNVAKSFCMDATEVTVAQYASCVAQGRCSKAREAVEDNAMLKRCNSGIASRELHPINCVTFGQAKGYCEAHGKRLPTWDEFAWLAAGPTSRTYPWGEEPPGAQVCWSGIEKRESTCRVGSFPDGDGAGGARDLVGNVAEWTASEGRQEGLALVYGMSWTSRSPELLRTRVTDQAKKLDAYHGYGFRCSSEPRESP